MRRLTKIRNLSLSSVGVSGAWSQPPFWSQPTEDDFVGRSGLVRGNGVLATTMNIRQAILSEARFQFQTLEGGRPGDLFDGPGLRLLDRPWPGGTTGDLIARMDQDASLLGNFYATVVDDGAGRRLRRLRPDWVTTLTSFPPGSDANHLEARPVGVMYHPPGQEPTIIPAANLVHYKPIPDPERQWQGMSWVSSIVREVEADNATTKHKAKFFENGASSNLILTYDPSVSQTNVKEFAQLFAEQHQGVDSAYKTMHLGGGADPKMVGSNMQQLDFKITQGAGESRVAAASLVGAVLAQFSEGMAGSSLNAGNFAASKRRFGDIGARPLWRSMAGALATVAPAPDGARLWYDDRDIPFLQDDAKDAADILAVNASAIANLARDGFEPESAVAAITAGDLRLLVHTGLPSVQVQPAEIKE